MDSFTKIKKEYVVWQAPSNIALVKYWGKHGVQLPLNPSISFSLKKSVTTTRLAWEKSEKFGLEYYFNGTRTSAFEARIDGYLRGLIPLYPKIGKYIFNISSENTFPHSAGIASSASSFAALALCLGELLGLDRKECSNLARLGSGSAARSIYGNVVTWGKWKNGMGHDEYASAISGINPIYHDFKDAILIIDGQAKEVSSSLGHALMKNHPFAENRVGIANQNCVELLAALQSGDLEKFGQILESEALMLHGLMMTSRSPYLLMKPNTIAVIEKIKRWRKPGNVPLYFTLDAGPNVHLLYPGSYSQKIRELIDSELMELLDGGCWIDDEVGEGPVQVHG